ncbi:MAG: glutathione peroxidase [Actinobacteria bacterium]|nr:glutathione peroxidase [Actinomycetota bacterium]
MSIYDISIDGLDGSPGLLAAQKGKVSLVVNVASRCGLTPQYEGLVKLHDKYGDEAFTVIGIPCNQFLGQEPGTPEEIKEFCSTTYGVDFPLSEKIDVNGDDRHPLYAALTAVDYSSGKPAGDITWNFEKFVVAPDGEIVGRFRPQTEPDDERIAKLIEENLPQAS